MEPGYKGQDIWNLHIQKEESVGGGQRQGLKRGWKGESVQMRSNVILIWVKGTLIFGVLFLFLPFFYKYEIISNKCFLMF